MAVGSLPLQAHRNTGPPINPVIFQIVFVSFIPADTPSELPLALPLPPPETPFTEFIQKNTVAVGYLCTIFPAHVSERAQSIAVVMVGRNSTGNQTSESRSRMRPESLNGRSKGSVLARLTTAEL